MKKSCSLNSSHNDTVMYIYAELKDFNELEVVDLNTYFEESFFESKKLVYLPLN